MCVFVKALLSNILRIVLFTVVYFFALFLIISTADVEYFFNTLNI